MARVRLADLNGPFWFISVSRMLKFGSEEGHFDPNDRLDHFGPVHFPTVPRPGPIDAAAVLELFLLCHKEFA